MQLKQRSSLVVRRALRMHRPAVLLVLSLLSAAAMALQTYQEPDAFLAETFAGKTPEPQAFWITSELKDQATKILGHKPPSLRTRYWQQGERSAWILEEVGKELPITAGLVVHENKIESVRVLIFRESRGWEVHNPAFVAQYDGVSLNAKHKLDRHIDGITGATLSVRALNKLARLALLYARQI